MVLIAIIGIAVSLANKKKGADAQKQRQAAQQREAAGTASAASKSAQNRTSPAKSPATPSKFPPAGPSKFPSAASSKRQTAAVPTQQPRPASASYGGTPRYTHVVTSTLEGGHTHTESSMTGEESCPPPKAAAFKQPETVNASAANTGALLDFHPDSVLKGILYAEILGKPKALQRE